MFEAETEAKTSMPTPMPLFVSSLKLRYDFIYRREDVRAKEKDQVCTCSFHCKFLAIALLVPCENLQHYDRTKDVIFMDFAISTIHLSQILCIRRYK